MASIHQKEFLIYEDQIEQNVYEPKPALHLDRNYCFWSEQILLILDDLHDDKFWHFTAFDLFMNSSHSISFSKLGKHCNQISLFRLSDDLGLIVEEFETNYCISLVELHWELSMFLLIERHKLQNTFWNIYVDKQKTSKFILKQCNGIDNPTEYQACKLLGNSIQFGETYNLDFSFWLYSQNKLIGFDIRQQKLEIKTYNLMQENEQAFQIGPLTNVIEEIYSYPRECIKERLYVTVRFQQNFGIIWIDLDTRQWTLMEFRTNLEIKRFGFISGNLMIKTKSEAHTDIFKSTVKFHVFPIRCPQFLRKLAWISIICKMKSEERNDPYKTALKYLPLNTDLRSPWFEDTDDESSSEQNQSDLISSQESNSDIPTKCFKPDEM